MAGPYDGALNDLRNCADDIDRSRTDAAAALHRTRDAQQQAAQAGFLGVARHLDRPVRTLEGHLTQLAEVAATIDRATSQLSGITTDLTPEEVVERLTSTKVTINAALDQSSTAIGTCAETRDQVAAALQGGHPEQIAGILETERRTLAATIRTLGAAATATDHAVATAGEIGDS
jgi:hypothetical protein